MSDTISPSILTHDGKTIYPTNTEYLLAFAIKGCKWAVTALEKIEEKRKKATELVESIFKYTTIAIGKDFVTFENVELKVRVGNYLIGSLFPKAMTIDNNLYLFKDLNNQVPDIYDLSTLK